jgi:hypothetical protein
MAPRTIQPAVVKKFRVLLGSLIKNFNRMTAPSTLAKNGGFARQSSVDSDDTSRVQLLDPARRSTTWCGTPGQSMDVSFHLMPTKCAFNLF